MRFALCLGVGLALLSLSDLMAQGNHPDVAQQCRALASKANNQLAFSIYPGAPEPLSNNEFLPKEIPTAAALHFYICVPVIPQDRGALGAVNIKIQIYSTATRSNSSGSSSSRAVEYENNSPRFQAALKAYRARPGAALYPSIDIADYQNYHGCSHPQPQAIRSEFHLQVGYQRTDDDPFRAKFVFRRDISPTCDVPQLVAEFIGGLPSLPPQAAEAIERYDPSVEKIVQRRSVILQYDFRAAASAADTQYIIYDLGKIGLHRCVRIEASYVFDKTHFGSDVIGVACITSPNE